MTSILIAGGGIAGLASALFLKARGHEPQVFEARSGVIDRVCGEGVLPFGVNILRKLGLYEQAVSQGQPFEGISYRCGKYRAEASFLDGQGIGIERRHLHQVMMNACAERGVPVHQGQTIDLEGDSGLVIDARGIRAKRGKNSRVASRRIGARTRVKASVGDRVSVSFERFGEIYLTPVGPATTSVAFLIDPKRMPTDEKWEPWLVNRFRECYPELDKGPIAALQFRAPIAGFALREDRVTRRVGDALCAFDPISGAGMSFALLCADRVALHIEHPDRFASAMVPAMKSIDSFTELLLWCSGGGWRSRLMTRQLARHGSVFADILGLHDAEHRITSLGVPKLVRLLAP